jgi:hypothetical protein
MPAVADLDLDQLRAALAKMTPGPWFWKPGSLRDIVTNSDTADTRVLEAAPKSTNGEHDTKGIVALRNAAPALLAECAAARERRCGSCGHRAPLGSFSTAWCSLLGVACSATKYGCLAWAKRESEHG